MKRLGLLIINLFISIIAHADGIEYFEHVKSLYQQERYEEAMQGFVSCKTYYSDELNISSINEWIDLCKTKIKEKNAAIQVKRQAEIADAKQRAAEAKIAEERKAYEAKQKERIEKKLLYISSNAFMFDKEYIGMHQAIKGYIADNSEFRFTDDPEMAYWCIYVTANATEHSFRGNYFTSEVITYIKITNEITNEILYKGEIIQCDAKNKSTIGYSHSAKKAYGIINKEIGDKILQQLK